MGLVVAGEHDPPPVAAAQSLPDDARQAELVLQPYRHRFEELTKAGWRESEIAFQQAVELEKRLLVECDVIQLLRPDARRIETIPDRRTGETLIVLSAGKSLLLRRRDDLPPNHQRGRAVMVEGRYSEDRSHACSDTESRKCCYAITAFRASQCASARRIWLQRIRPDCDWCNQMSFLSS